MPRKLAFTIPELLIYCAIFGVISTVCCGVFTMCLRYYRTTEERSNLQRQLMIARRDLEQELAESLDSSVVQDTNAVAFVSARTASGTVAYDPSGQLLWQSYVCYYVDDTGPRSALLRKCQPFTTPTTSPKPTPTVTVLKATPAKSPVTLRTVAFDVTDMGVALTPPLPAATRQADLKLTAATDRRTDDSGKPFQWYSLSLDARAGIRSSQAIH